MCNLQKIDWLLSFVASCLQRNIESYIDGIYIFCHLVSKIKQRSLKVFEEMGSAYQPVQLTHKCLLYFSL